MTNNTARLNPSPDLPSVDRAPVWNDYINEGFALTPIKHGTKQAYIKNWNLEENAIKTVEDAKVLNGSAGVLLAHCDQPLMTLDIDDYRYAEQWFNDKGIELGDLFMRHDAVQIQSGRENKAKLLFKLDEPLLTHQVKDEGVMAIEFRCALKDGKSVQDVLPPSIHPDTKEPYKWHGDYRNIPTLPTELLTLWKSLLEQNKPKNVEHPVDVVKPDRIKKALDLIDPTSLSYDDWINVGMGIHSECPDIVGLVLWDEWSQRDEERYKVGDCDQRWNSFKNGSGVTIGTVFKMAYPEGSKRFLGNDHASQLVETSSVVGVSLDTASDTTSINSGTGVVMRGVADILKEPTSDLDRLKRTALLRPDNFIDYPTSGETIFTEAKNQEALYRKDRQVFRVVTSGRLDPVDGKSLPSIVDKLASASNKLVMGAFSGNHGDVTYKPTRLKRTEAEHLLASDEVEILNEIRMVSPTPFITEDGRILERGYHADYQVLVTGGEVEDVGFNEAVKALNDLLCDFKPESEADRSRLMASFITPAFKPSKMITQSPIFYFEADESQSGKGLYAETAPCIYDCIAENVKSRKGGVGSLEEIIDSALIAGRSFIMVDNYRGNLNSPWLEGLITAGEASHSARVAYKGATVVDTTAANWALTSNGMMTTPDIVNRMCVVKLRKQDSGYRFIHNSKEGFHQHIKLNQPFYLGCVLSIVKNWIDEGKPKGNADGHSFVTWAETLDYIVTEYFNYPSLMDGMKEVRRTLGDQRLSWLRMLAIAVEQDGELDRQLRASELVEIALNANNGAEEPPNCKSLHNQSDERQAQAFGRALKPIRKNRNSVEVGGFTVSWYESQSRGDQTNWFYTFTRGGVECPF